MINIKDLYAIFKEAGKIDEYQKILELLDDSLKNREKIEELTSENKRLKEQLAVARKIRFENNAYYLGQDGPFCMNCYDSDKKLIRLPERPGFDSLQCPTCKNYFDQGRGGGLPVMPRRPQNQAI
ncbi:MAG: hypothetical protein AAB377_02300 [Patescibacteria group bacterium]